MKTLRLGTTMLVALALLVPLSVNAAAPSRFDDNKVRVSFADLNIQSKAGAEVLYARMRRASIDACGVDSYRQLGSLKRVSIAKQCYEKTMDKFVSRIDSEELKKLHNG